MEERIRAIVNEYLAPLVAQDGGILEVIEVVDARVVIRLSGTCRGCPGLPFTVDHVITPTLRQHVDPRIQVVTQR